MNSYSAYARLLLVLFWFVVGPPASAQAPTWQSAQTVAAATAAVTGSFSVAMGTAVDATGNVFVTGYFKDTVVFGTTTLTSLGSYDVFVAKFNPVSNQVVWAVRAGGTSDDRAYALAVSGTSVYVSGPYFSPSVGFGPFTLGNSGGGVIYTDVFVAKLTDAGSTGSFVWAQRAGGNESDYPTSLAVAGTTVYVAGYYEGRTTAIGTTTLTNAGGSTGTYDGFVAKLSDAGSTGSFVWAQGAGGTGNDYITAVAASGTSVYVAGVFDSPTLGLGATTLTNAGGTTNDVFVAKLTDAGSTRAYVWAQRAGGTGDDVAQALAVSGTSVYVAGDYTSSPAGFGATTLTNAGGRDGFVTKLTDAGPTGSFVWAERAGGAGIEYARALAVSGTGVYVAGYFNGPTASFGPTTLVNAGSASTYDLFVTRLSDGGSTGRFDWAQRAGGTGGDFADALAVSGTAVYVAGDFDGPTAGFGTLTITNPRNGATVGYLASLTDPTVTATAGGLPLVPAQLFPNPAHHTAILLLPAGTGTTPLTLTNALGRAVRTYPAPTGREAVLDLQGLPAGFYLLRGAGLAQRLLVE